MARIPSRIISTQSSQKGFYLNQDNVQKPSNDFLTMRKRDIGLDDYVYRDTRFYGEFQSEDFSFLLNTPQQSIKDIDFLKNHYQDTLKDIKWYWKDFGEIPNEFPLNINTPTYTPSFFNSTNNWWNYYSIPSVGSIWLFFLAFVLIRRRR